MGADRATELPFDALRWAQTTIPGSSPPIHTARFPSREDSDASSLLVRFSPGWCRPSSGHYPAHEEILLLEGDLTVSGTTYQPGDYAWLPAGFLRSASLSAGGCLALARFSGPPVWIPSDEPGRDFQPEDVTHLHWSDAERRPSPLGHGQARLLRHGDDFSSWILDRDSDDASLTTRAIEMFSLTSQSWTWTQPARLPPQTEKPCFVRAFHHPQR